MCSSGVTLRSHTELSSGEREVFRRATRTWMNLGRDLWRMPQSFLEKRSCLAGILPRGHPACDGEEED